MRSQASTKPNRKPWSRAALWSALIALIPVSFVAWLSIREIRASQEVRATLRQLRDSGIPIDNGSAEREFAEQTSEKGTRDWAEVLALLGNSWLSGLGAELPYVGTGKIPVRLDPDRDWAQVSQAIDYLEVIRPALARLQVAAQHESPVWQPVRFNGIATLLGPIQDANRVVGTLQLSGETALYQADSNSALRDIALIQDTAAAFDWDNFLVAKYTFFYMEGAAWQLMRRSLYSNPWTAQQLTSLRESILPPVNVRQKWPRILDHEQALLLMTIRDGTSNAGHLSVPRFVSTMWSLPSVQVGYIERSIRWRGIASDGLPQMQRRVEEILGKRQAEPADLLALDNLAAGLLSWYPSAVARFVRHEDDRRLTLSALAVKQFHLQEGRWPARLSDLTKVSLTPQDWATVNDGSFGYELVGDTAVVWSHPPNRKPVPTQRPDYEQTELDMKEAYDSQYIVEIR